MTLAIDVQGSETNWRRKVSAYLRGLSPGDARLFGVKGDNSTDDSAAFNAAAAACASSGDTLYIPPLAYSIANPVLFPCNVESARGAQFNCSGSAATGIAVLVASAATTSPTRIKKGAYSLPYVSNTHTPGGGWNSGSVGVKFLNLYQARIELQGAYGFEIGVAFEGNQQGGTGLNTVFLGEQVDNKINLDLYGADSSGICNENVFIGGNCRIDSGETTTGTRGIRLRGTTAGAEPNNNVFIKPDLEGYAEYAIEINGGTGNTFIAPRLEVANDILLDAQTGCYCQGNDFTIPLSSPDVAVTIGTGGGSISKNVLRTQDMEFLPDAGIAFMNPSSDSSPVWRVFPSGSMSMADFYALASTPGDVSKAVCWATAQKLFFKAYGDAAASPRGSIEFATGNAAFNNLTAGGVLKLGNAYTAGAPAATGYVTLQDSSGTTYKVLVST